jgi:aspartyl-tRNA(Asn)/glutamyl-tRNA(Gln) amidotransferase subunit A
MARSVRDCARSLEVMAGPSPRDPRTPPVPLDAYSDTLTAGVAGKLVGVPERYFFEHTDPDLAACVRTALDALVAAGARTVDFDLGWPVDGEPGGGFYATEQTVAVAGYWPERADEFGADIVSGMHVAERVSGIEAAAVGLVELNYRARLAEQARSAGIDIVVAPSQAFPPPRAGVEAVPFAGRPAVPVTVAMCGLTEVFNVLGWPAISVPCGLDGNGLPVGAQIAALPWREADCLAAAAVVEQALGPLPPP